LKPFLDSASRSELYGNWVNYSEDLRDRLGTGFIQWLDGNFVTQKKNPNDLDLASFLPYELFHRHEEELEKFSSFSWEEEGLDAYLLRFIHVITSGIGSLPSTA